MKDLEKVELLLEDSGHSCTIEPTMVENRKSILNRINSMTSHTIEEDDRVVLILGYSSKVAHMLVDFILQEQTCCNFIDFSLRFEKDKDNISLGISSKSIEISSLKELIQGMITL